MADHPQEITDSTDADPFPMDDATINALRARGPTTDWTGETFAERIHNCRAMLRLHGFLTDAESGRVKQRQMKRGVVPHDAIIIDRNGQPK